MKKIIGIFLGIIAPLFFVKNALAHCPLCVGGAVVGLSIARFLGIDDAITGVWLAALTAALAFWTESYLSKKIKFAFWKPTIYLVFFALMIWSLYAFNDWTIANLKFYLINKHAGLLFGVEKLTFGMIIGGIVFYVVDAIDDFFIKRHGKVYFQFQRVIVPLSSMLILSLFIYYLINYVI